MSSNYREERFQGLRKKQVPEPTVARIEVQETIQPTAQAGAFGDPDVLLGPGGNWCLISQMMANIRFNRA